MTACRKRNPSFAFSLLGFALRPVGPRALSGRGAERTRASADRGLPPLPEMPPKKPPPAAGPNKKADQKKKEKIIEVRRGAREAAAAAAGAGVARPSEPPHRRDGMGRAEP